MKVKRFNNLWAMGLIIFGALLVGFYVMKIVCPQFIVGVAEIPSIINFGNFVDRNVWAKHIFNVFVSLSLNYFFFCACCRTKKLSKKSFAILIAYVLFLRLLSQFLPNQYSAFNYVLLVLIPFIMCTVDGNASKETFMSTVLCFSFDIISQLFSLVIRDLMPMIENVNSATLFVLVVDVLIWRLLFYMYFNNKERK